MGSSTTCSFLANLCEVKYIDEQLAVLLRQAGLKRSDKHIGFGISAQWISNDFDTKV